jgi:mRNA interferase MazF
MNRGEVWEINLDPTIGAEMQKIRPCVIVSRDALSRLPLKIVVPITEWKENFARAAWHVKIEPTPQNGLTKSSSADTYQVRSITDQRFVRRIGALESEIMERIKQGLLISLDIG